MATVYAVSMLTALVKIELNIIGAHLFIENSVDDDLSKRQNMPVVRGLPASVQQRYLGHVENFVKSELYRLIEKIETLTEEVFRK